jgi:diaminopimelate decarboxylase
MTDFNEKDGQLYADAVALEDVARKFGTPAYVYSASSIRAQYEKLNRAMEKTLPAGKQPLLCYACKANSNVAILSLIRSLGAGLEIVSEGELVRGMKAGFSPEKIVSTGVGKQRSEIEACLAAGIHQFNVESLPELERINQVAGERGVKAPVVFRLNPDVKGGGHSKISTGQKHDKFGLSAKDVTEGYKMAKGMDNVTALGLSMHIGSQVFTVESFKKAFDKFPALVKDLRAQGFTVSRLDIGGGFPIQYNEEKLLDLDAYATWVRDIILPLEAEIIMEPGRYLVGNAGVLLSEVLYIKENAERSFLVLDAAMNDLIRPTLYEAYHGIEPVKNRNAAKKVYDVCGPVCESSDFFAKDREIPTMKQGDLAVIRSAGAYGAAMGSNYNTRPLLPEILVDGDKIELIRKRQGYDDILAGEAIPAWLKA